MRHLNCVSVALFAAAMLASAGAKAQSAMNFSGETGLTCAAGLEPAAQPGDSPRIALGELREFCNDPQGFEVWLDYPSGLSGASLYLDGAQMTLPPSGAIRVDHLQGPAVASHSLSLDNAGEMTLLPITVRLVPASIAGAPGAP